MSIKALTVGELIEVLQEFPKDFLAVMVHDQEQGLCSPVGTVSEVRFEFDDRKPTMGDITWGEGFEYNAVYLEDIT